MPDYREIYLTLFRATERAIDTLVEAQRICEELYLRQPELDVLVLHGEPEEE